MKFIFALLLMLPAMAFAAGGGGDAGGGGGGGGDGGAGDAGGESDGPDPTPKTTKSSSLCVGVHVWDEQVQNCVRPEASHLDTDGLYYAVRELAYAGRYEDAQGILRAMPDQTDYRVLTYWGFTHRKLGHIDVANAFYEKAIEINPDNILARSYMGQGFVEEGRMAEAVAQWMEIRARGGKGTWAERSLREALQSGRTFNY